MLLLDGDLALIPALSDLGKPFDQYVQTNRFGWELGESLGE